MDANTGTGAIGLAVRRARHARGLTLEAAAGRAGRSKAWLSNVENGRRPLERRSDIAALAGALEVSADTLIGQPAPEIGPGRRAWNLMPLRTVLLDYAPDDPPDIPGRPVAQLAALTAEVTRRVRWAEWDPVIRDLPPLIGELEMQAATAADPERGEALRLLVSATAAAWSLLRYAAQPDLGWVAAERGRQAAALTGDPAWEAAAFGSAHARSSSNRPRALMITPRIADRLEPLIGGDRFAREVYVMLSLSAALACAVSGDHAGAAAHGEEAARTAAPMGDQEDAWEMAGPSNVSVWRTLLTVEAGDAGRALEHANAVNPRVLPSRNRRAALRIERARALAMLGGAGRECEAIAELRRAERLSAPQVHNSPMVRELVTVLLDRARREAGGRELRGLAWRMGVI